MASQASIAQASAEVNFYHLTTIPKMVALPKLLEKCLEAKKNACVYFSQASIMEEVSAYLWSYSSMTMIPHGKDYEEFASEQPIILTNKFEYPVNSAEIAIYFELSPQVLKEYTKIIFLFDGNDGEELKIAREKWKLFKNENYEILYWKQDEKGSWSKQ